VPGFGDENVDHPARDLTEDISHCRITCEHDTKRLRTWAHFRLGGVYIQVGRYDEAIEHLQEALKLSNQNMRELALLGYAYAVAGNHEKAREILNLLLYRSQQRYVSSYNLALIYTALGEFDTALDHLSVAISQRSPWLVFLKIDPRFDPINALQKFQDLVKEVGLPT
jgi:tetratricopeptide (TPR) repeat protein